MPAAGRRAQVQLAADQPRSLGHALQAEAAAGARGRVEAARRRRSRAARRRRPRRSAHISTRESPRRAGRRWPAPPGRSGRSPSAGPRPSRSGRPRCSSAPRCPVRSAKPRELGVDRGTRPWSSSAAGRSWRARFSSSSIAWLASRLSSATSSALLRAARPGASASRRSRIAVRAWLTSSCRSRATPPALLLLGAQHQLAGAPALGLHPLEQAAEGPAQAVDLRRRVAAPARSWPARRGRSPRSASIRCSSGANRRWSIHRFTQKVRTSARPAPGAAGAGRCRCRRGWPTSSRATERRASPARTLAATTWPIRESSRRRFRRAAHEWGLHPISAGRPLDDTQSRSFGGGSRRSSAQVWDSISGAPLAPRCRFVEALSFLKYMNPDRL